MFVVIKYPDGTVEEGVYDMSMEEAMYTLCPYWDEVQGSRETYNFNFSCDYVPYMSTSST